LVWGRLLNLVWNKESSRRILDINPLTIAPTAKQSAGSVVLSLITFTFLNPHVYLDTVILLGSIANQFSAHRWLFALGASSASFMWFTTIGFGARAASKYMTRPIFWKILDSVIAAIMFAIAITLVSL
jgi:L-lysine exporter family protein LysE/ArgO